MNLLEKWEKDFKQTILTEIANARIELTHANIPQIIQETSFIVRSKKHKEKCPYYAQNTNCHPKIKDLNCFLCACPNYDSSVEDGACKINSKKGKWHYHKNLPTGRVWDCSDCTINHTSNEVEKYLTKNINNLQALLP